MLLKSKISENKNFIIFNLLTMLLYIILYYQIPKYEKMIETTILKNSISYIDSTTDNIIKNIIKSDNIIKDILENRDVKNRVFTQLSLLNNQNINYIYLIFKTKNGKYRYLLDVSKKERAEQLEIFYPIDPQLWDKVYKNKKTEIIFHKKVEGVGFTYMKPIIKNNRVIAILSLDYVKSSMSDIEQLVTSIKYVLIILFSLNFILLNISIYSIIKSFKNEKKLYIDSLTKLYNYEYLKKISKDIDITNYNILIIDIDFLYKINSNFGFKKGDEVIQSVVKTILQYKTKGDIVIRYTGANFLFFQKKPNNRKIAELMRIDIEKNENIPVTISVGKNENVKDNNIDLNLKNAQLALYKAKNSGRNQVCDFNDKLIHSEALSIETIKDALDNDDLICLYQPIIDLKDNKTSHYEALVRLIVDKKIVAPYKFLPVIENTFLYTTLTKKVLYFNIETLKKYKDIKVSINFTADDLLNDSIIDILENNKDLSERILLEILETQEISDYEKLSKIIARLKIIGYKFAIDDFGSGYSNLMNILKMDINYIKLDASIIKNIHKDEKSFLITENMINFSKKTNIKTICEYVENEEILDVLKKLNADYGQGYFFSKPEKIESFSVE